MDVGDQHGSPPRDCALRLRNRGVSQTGLYLSGGEHTTQGPSPWMGSSILLELTLSSSISTWPALDDASPRALQLRSLREDISNSWSTQDGPHLYTKRFSSTRSDSAFFQPPRESASLHNRHSA